MENVNASGIIPVFLSGLLHEDGQGADQNRQETASHRRLLLACFGSNPVLSGTVKNMAFGFGRKNARTTITRIQDSSDPINPLRGYDGVFIGIAPDGTGSTEQAFSFIRNHLEQLSAMPVALFFLLSRAPKTDNKENPFKDLSDIYPLDVRIFDGTAQNLAMDVTAWAQNEIWPLMETGWLADLIFPEPAPPAVLAEPEIYTEMAEPMVSYG
jgi:hypothetical protein